MIKVKLLTDGGYEDELATLDFDTVFHAQEYSINGAIRGCDIKADDLRSHGAVIDAGSNIQDGDGFVYFSLGTNSWMNKEYEVIDG